MASITHDLRTPLNGIIYLIEKIRCSKTNLDIQKYLDWARANSDLLMNNINDILDYWYNYLYYL